MDNSEYTQAKPERAVKVMSASLQYREVLKNSTVIQKLLNIGSKDAASKSYTEEQSSTHILAPLKKFFALSIGLTFINMVVLIFLSYKLTTGLIVGDSAKDTLDQDSQLDTLELLTMDVSAKVDNLSNFVFFKMNNLNTGVAKGDPFSVGKTIADKLEAIKDKIDPTKKLAVAGSLQDLNASKRKVFFMHMRLNKYFRKNNAYPQSITELKKALDGDLPIEDISHSSGVHFDKNNLGGWFYNRNDGRIQPNVP